MEKEYFYINRAFQDICEKTGERILIIETELLLASYDNTKVNTLLTEIADLKNFEPDLFKGIENIEIRRKSLGKALCQSAGNIVDLIGTLGRQQVNANPAFSG